MHGTDSYGRQVLVRIPVSFAIDDWKRKAVWSALVRPHRTWLPRTDDSPTLRALVNRCRRTGWLPSKVSTQTNPYNYTLVIIKLKEISVQCRKLGSTIFSLLHWFTLTLQNVVANGRMAAATPYSSSTESFYSTNKKVTQQKHVGTCRCIT